MEKLQITILFLFGWINCIKDKLDAKHVYINIYVLLVTWSKDKHNFYYQKAQISARKFTKELKRSECGLLYTKS